jgi:hypothetical protein
MTSTFSWLAHDEAERRRLHEVVELFREQGTLDDLGLGSVRDAFANLLFPGTSVLHTRARYLLFIPWIYLRLERQGVTSSEIATRARRDEVRLIDALLTGGETRGVIGERARADLKLLPSTAYWSGLRVLGFRLFPGTQEQYHRSFDSHRQLLRSAPRVGDDEDPIAALARNWHPTLDALATEQPAFLEETTFELSADEAAFVRELILRRASGSYLAFLCKAGSPSRVSFAWQHARRTDAPADIQRQLEFAAAFSTVMYGASLLYNLLLAQRRQMPDQVTWLMTRINHWSDAVQELRISFEWDEFWGVAAAGNPRISTATKSFIEAWFTSALDRGADVVGDAGAGRLIERRERQTKRAQARLSNPRRLETWTEPVGLGQLDFRWTVVQGIVNDVLRALHGSSSARS